MKFTKRAFSLLLILALTTTGGLYASGADKADIVDTAVAAGSFTTLVKAVQAKLGELSCPPCRIHQIIQPPWRNWLARSAVNRKVGGSSPPGGAAFFQSKVIFLSRIMHALRPMFEK